MKCQRILAAITVMGMAVMTQACGGAVQSGRSIAEPELGVIPVIVRNSDVRFPMEKLRMTPDQGVTLAIASDLVLWKCMTRLGFDYELPDRPANADEYRTIGVVEESEAAEFGYKNPRIQPQLKAASEEKERQAKAPRSPEMLAALHGTGLPNYNGVAVPAGGCVGELRKALGRPDGSSDTGDDNFVLRLESESSDLAEQDSRLKDAFAQWSGCMSEAGFHYRDPWAANDDPAFGGDSTSPAEIATAKADVACRNRFDVNGTWVAVRSAYQYRLIEANAEALQQHQHAVDDRLRKAADIRAAAGR